jgi:hypothetical protein
MSAKYYYLRHNVELGEATRECDCHNPCVKVVKAEDYDSIVSKLEEAEKNLGYSRQRESLVGEDVAALKYARGRIVELESRLDSLTAVVRQVIECGPSVISDRCADTLENALVVERQNTIGPFVDNPDPGEPMWMAGGDLPTCDAHTYYGEPPCPDCKAP